MPTPIESQSITPPSASPSATLHQPHRSHSASVHGAHEAPHLFAPTPAAEAEPEAEPAEWVEEAPLAAQVEEALTCEDAAISGLLRQALGLPEPVSPESDAGPAWSGGDLLDVALGMGEAAGLLAEPVRGSAAE